MVEDPSLWDKSSEAQKLLRERSRVAAYIEKYQALEIALNDNVELAELAALEQDEQILDQVMLTLEALQSKAHQLEIESLLSGEVDANDTFLEIHAGAGGTESQDWAAMLLRMYARWSESKGYNVSFEDETPGEEAGIKSATIKISGHNSYGWLKNEIGVHRLVRISPYDSNARRHTSFASVGAAPVIDDSIEIEINEVDLRIDTYRASGAGGQHVNRTDSAVRITHGLTGIVVQCQSDRSQHKNRESAMRMLRARLYDLELQNRELEKRAMHDSKSDIGWGQHIRSYVLHPYQMVKDLRTGVERGNAQSVLDGDLDDYMSAALAARLWRAGGISR